MIFVDTGVWFSWFVPTDTHHARVSEWLAQITKPLVTSDYVIDETMTLLVARKHVARALGAGHAFFHENLTTIHFVNPSQVRRSWLLFQQRAASGWSFTDCTSKIVIDDLQIGTAAALDDHFRQFGNVIVVP